MNRKGFTYLEIVIAFAIFGLMLLIVLRISNTVYSITQHNLKMNQMQHIAQLELENYRTGILDIPSFLNETGFTLITENHDSNGLVLNRELQNTDVNGKYTVLIDETSVNTSTSDVRVEVQMNGDDMDPVVIFNRILVN